MSRIIGGIKELFRINGKEGLSWFDGRVVLVDVPIDAEQAKQWLPWALRLSTPAKASVLFAHYPKTTFSPPYREAALLLHVKLFGVFPVAHCPWMLVDDDTALILGREMLGYAKKMGEISLVEENGYIKATASRRGFPLMSFSAKLGQSLMSNPPVGVGKPIVNMRGLINAAMPAHLLAFKFTEKIDACNQLDEIDVQVNSSEYDPVGIVTGKAEGGTIRTCTLGMGKLPMVMRVWLVNPMLLAFLMKLRAL